jgi:hypothetical protein
VVLDSAANERGAERISTEGSRVAVWAIPTDEECTIAGQTIKVLRSYGVNCSIHGRVALWYSQGEEGVIVGQKCHSGETPRLHRE